MQHAAAPVALATGAATATSRAPALARAGNDVAVNHFATAAVAARFAPIDRDSARRDVLLTNAGIARAEAILETTLAGSAKPRPPTRRCAVARRRRGGGCCRRLSPAGGGSCR